MEVLTVLVVVILGVPFALWFAGAPLTRSAWQEGHQERVARSAASRAAQLEAMKARRAARQAKGLRF